MDDDQDDRSRIEKAIEAVKDMASSTTYAANSAATASEEEKGSIRRCYYGQAYYLTPALEGKHIRTQRHILRGFAVPRS